MNDLYRIPTQSIRAEIEVKHSRFVCTIGYADSPEKAKRFIQSIHDELPEADHHVYAFRCGYGNTVIEGVSDAGEPSGTAGPPILAILRGTDIGDVVVVVSRYWGGTKLGTGGLVRAYSDATRLGLEQLPTELKISKTILGIECNYTQYQLIQHLMKSYPIETIDSDFGLVVALIIKMPSERVNEFVQAVVDMTAATAEITVLSAD
ncbi:MAG: YigZ family protein [Phototrophicaceae bacterium]